MCQKLCSFHFCKDEKFEAYSFSKSLKFREQRNWNFLLCFSCLIISGIRGVFSCPTFRFALWPTVPLKIGFLNSWGLQITEWWTIHANVILIICFTVRLITRFFQITISSSASKIWLYDCKNSSMLSICTL